MAELLKKPKDKMSDHDLAIAFMLDDEYIETKEEWDMVYRALMSAMDWGHKASGR